MNIQEIESKKILEKLRREKAPRHIAMILFSDCNNLDQLIARLKEWKDLYYYERGIRAENRVERWKPPRNLTTCFKCGIVGHISKYFRSNSDHQGKKSINQIQDDELNKNEKFYVYLNGNKCLAIFDTESVTSIIGKEYEHIYNKIKITKSTNIHINE